MTVGILGLQGAVQDHFAHLKRCGADYKVVRDSAGLAAIDRLIIPGGESTVMAKFMRQFHMLSPLSERIAAGMPVWGICAGSILLAEIADGAQGALKALPVKVTRNAYGRQLDSRIDFIEIAKFGIPHYPAIFIRAPKIVSAGPEVISHAIYNEHPVFVTYNRVMATTFHPELNNDDIFYDFFLSL
ncbi:MAG: pyridoxal 5'-phosphate synthase glutaminase subunit PdxT [Desulfobacteraceae bacterium]|nr:pyridoxal 5'-phosphate synthase glutaminase subunit PdxT [Desulfobacteraceae bacterium]